MGLTCFDHIRGIDVWKTDRGDRKRNLGSETGRLKGCVTYRDEDV